MDSFLENVKERFFLHFPAFRYKNFNLFFFGQVVSVIGTWMQTTAQGWLVLQLTNSPFKLGLISAIQYLPALFLSLYAGVVVDKFSKRKILLFTQSAFAILAFILGLLVSLKVVKYYQILIIAFITGLINTIDMPARQAFYIELVPKENLMNAIALNSLVVNLARIVGPIISGLLIGAVGYQWSFYLNAMSFIAVIIGIFFIVERTQKSSRFSFKDLENVNEDVKSGVAYIRGIPIMVIAIVLFTIVNVFGLNFNVLIPVLAKDVYNLGATGYGLLMGILGIGALSASLLLAAISYKGVKHSYLFLSALTLGITLFITGLIKSYNFVIVITMISGFSMVVCMNTTNMLLQTSSSDEYRGRVMSIYSLIFLGFTLFGSLITGTLSDFVSVRFTYAFVGVVLIVSTVLIYFLLYRKIFKDTKKVGYPSVNYLLGRIFLKR
jgi:MFS family permease